MLLTIEQNIDRVACKVSSLYKHSFTAHCVNQLCCSTHIVFRLNVHPGDFLRLRNIRCQHVSERQQISTECPESTAEPSVPFRLSAYIHRVNETFFDSICAAFPPQQTSPPASAACQSSRRPCRYPHRLRPPARGQSRRNILLFQHMHGVFRHDGYDHAHRVHAVRIVS